MLELWLNFTDPDGVTRRVRVEGKKFVIGRQPDCDLAISDSRLSRVHAEIDRFGGIWEISDARSSNGTFVNGNPVFESVPLADGQCVSLGGFLINVEVIAEEPQAGRDDILFSPQLETPLPIAAATERSGVPIVLIFAPPVLALFLVIAGGGIAYFATAGDRTIAVAKNDDPIIEDDPQANSKDADSTPVAAASPTLASTGPTPTPANLSENAKVEVNGANFLRRIAQNDPNIFLTADQAKRVMTKIRSVSGSPAVADNLRAATQNGAGIKSLATDRGLKPQLLAVAAVAKLGTTKGDVLATAKTVAEVLDKLVIQIGNERADDCLLMIAAYEQGASGDTMKMRNLLQNLATESNESSRTIRTIWFLEKRGKITSSEFDRALTFLAIGTIAQNPKEFGVSIDALDI